MTEKKEKFPSTFTVDNFSSTAKLASNEVKVPVGSVETINEKEYDPFDHRPTEHQNSSLGSLIHLVKSSLGTGILAMPNAIKNAGLAFGFVGTIIIGILCTHCVHILVKAAHEMSMRTKTPCLGFAETAGEVFRHGPKKLQKWATTAKVVVDIALILTYFLGGSVYIVFIADSLKQVMNNHFPDLGWDSRVYMGLVLIPIILTCQFRQLRYLVPFSFIANVSMFVSFGITLYYLFFDFKERDDVKLIAEISTLPSFFSTVIFAMEGIGVVMPVENSMKKPQQFLGCPGVLNISMTIVVALYSVIGFFGYMRYGATTKASITFNLPNETLAEVGKLCIAVAVFFTYSLQFHVPMEIAWKKLEHVIQTKYHNLTQITMRTVVVALSCVIAVAVPNLEPIITLVGAICLSTLGILIPSVVDTVLCWEGRLGFMKWRLIKNIILGCFSLFALFSGSYFAIDQILNPVSED